MLFNQNKDDENSEFEVIKTLFKPLAGLEPSARGLNDDVSLLAAKEGMDIAVSSDAIVSGIHFFHDDPMDQIAQKLLRVNISDIVAKGAKPFGYQLTCFWPRSTTYEMKAQFADGLRRDQSKYNLSLLGGDTVVTDGPLAFSVTIFGHVPHGLCLSRSGAQIGDRILVSGPIGDSHIGLMLRHGMVSTDDLDCQRYFNEAYCLPKPQTGHSQLLLEAATASIDVSDGLLADIGHIGRASGVDVHIDLHAVPTSIWARQLMAMELQKPLSPLDIINGGDDYQILCTAKPDKVARFEKAGFFDIGRCEAIAGTLSDVYLMADNQRCFPQSKAWVHGR